MTSTDNLFLLIKSLSKAEKRFFTLEASNYSLEDGNDYLLLYKLLDKQAEYNEKELKKSLKGSILKRLPSAKNYLYNLLLKTLTQFHNEQNPHFQISNLLQEVDLLHFRGLYKAANKLLKKAKDLAIATQKHHFLMSINEWEISLANFEPTFEKSQKKIALLQKERLSYLQNLNNFSNIELLYEEVINATYNIGKARTPEEKKIYQDFFTRQEVLDAEQSSCLNTQTIMYATKSSACHMIGDSPEEVFDYSQKRAELFLNASLELQLDNAYLRCYALFDYIQALLTNQQKEEAQQQLEALKTFWETNKDNLANATNAMYFFTVLYHSSKILMLEGDFEAVTQLATSQKEKFEQLQGSIDQNRALYILPLNFGYCCFVRQYYDEALFWFRYILNDTTITIRPDLLGFVRILHLLVQYELKNKQILPYYTESARRYLSKNNKLFQFEQLFLNSIKQLAFKTTWDSQYEQILKKLKTKLQKLSEVNSFEKQCIQQYYLIEWVDSKLQQKSYEEIILNLKI